MTIIKLMIYKSVYYEKMQGCGSDWQKDSEYNNNCGETEVYFIKQ
jgi:hypothetical protein